MYTMKYTRPDDDRSYSGEDHCKTVKNILKYLTNTKDVIKIYGRSKLKLEGLTDSSFLDRPRKQKIYFKVKRYLERWCSELERFQIAKSC